MSDLTIFGKTYTDVKGIKATDTDGNEVVYGGGYSADEIAMGTISGDIILTTTTIRNSAFEGTNITSVYSDSVTTIRSRSACFRNCKQLKSVSFPNLTDGWATSDFFNGCSALTDVNLPKLDWMHSSFLRYCTSLELGVFPKVTGLNAWCFNGDTNLHTLDFGALEAINNYDEFSKSNLSVLIIRTTSKVCTLGNAGSFSNTPFASNGTGGKLYVPQSLISSYQSANNWSTILGYTNNQILPIEGSYYETHYADGTPIE